MYEMHFFCTSASLSLLAAGLFSRSWLRGTQGERLYTRRKFLAPAGLRGACSGRSELRELARNHGVAFHRAIPNEAHANPQDVIVFYSSFIFSPLSAALSQLPRQPSKGRQPRCKSRSLSFSLCDCHDACVCVRVS